MEELIFKFSLEDKIFFKNSTHSIFQPIFNKTLILLRIVIGPTVFQGPFFKHSITNSAILLYPYTLPYCFNRNILNSLNAIVLKVFYDEYLIIIHCELPFTNWFAFTKRTLQFDIIIKMKCSFTIIIVLFPLAFIYYSK
jgi:hypothetical protein